MYRLIMVPLDGTRFSEEALPVAIRLARASGAKLLLVRVVDRTVPAMLLASPLAGESWGDTPANEALQYLASLADAVVASTGVITSATVLRGGIASSVRNEAARVKCDLIVMGTHGRQGRERANVGSVAEAVLKQTSCPVLTVKNPKFPSDSHRVISGALSQPNAGTD
jgi:nucleotide-binding universal stress UspA family protein